MYRYILANIKTYEPVMQSNDIDGIIVKMKKVIEPIRFKWKEPSISVLIKDCVEESGFFIEDGYTIIDTHSKSNNSHLKIYIKSDIKMSYEELLSNIQQSIRNIKISKLVD